MAYTGHFLLQPSTATHQAAGQLSLTWYRAYDPRTGVWLNRDPIEEHGGVHLYRFCENQPTRLRDTNGLFTSYAGVSSSRDDITNRHLSGIAALEWSPGLTVDASGAGAESGGFVGQASRAGGLGTLWARLSEAILAAFAINECSKARKAYFDCMTLGATDCGNEERRVRKICGALR